jgi:hypothetical protein
MSNLRVHRTKFDSRCTMGNFYLEGQQVAFTLEPPKLDPPAKPRAIPAGTYKFIIAYSPVHGRLLPLLINVPDFTGVEIHIGNWPKDTKGCILVGKQQGDDVVEHSAEAFQEIFPKLTGGTIEITEELAA